MCYCAGILSTTMDSWLLKFLIFFIFCMVLNGFCKILDNVKLNIVKTTIMLLSQMIYIICDNNIIVIIADDIYRTPLFANNILKYAHNRSHLYPLYVENTEHFTSSRSVRNYMNHVNDTMFSIQNVNIWEKSQVVCITGYYFRSLTVSTAKQLSILNV